VSSDGSITTLTTTTSAAVAAIELEQTDSASHV